MSAIHGPSSRSSSFDISNFVDDGVSTSTLDAASGDPITELAVLLAQSYREDRKLARAASDAAEAARVREVEQQVQEMRDKASSIRVEGWLKGGTMALSGGYSMLGACLSIDESDAAAARITTGFSGAGKVVEGLGFGFGTRYGAAAQEHQAQSDLHDARANAYEATSEKYRDEADEAQRMARKSMEFLERMKESEDGTRAAASGIRG
jgi:hypothetical protein